MRRYYSLIAISLLLTGTYSFLFNSERSITSMLFTTVAMAIPAGVIFLFLDYSLTLIGRHHMMKYYYLLVVVTYVLYLPAVQALPYMQLVIAPFLLILSFATIAIIVAFFRYAFSPHNNQPRDFDHALHAIADEYQKRKDRQQPWEEQVFELFEEKFTRWKEKRSKSAA